MNNESQDMVRVWENLFYNNRITATTEFLNPDFKNLSKSFGIDYLLCDSKNNLNKIISTFLNKKGPIVLECKVEKDYCFPLVPPGAALDNMILEPNNIKLNNKYQAPC